LLTNCLPRVAQLKLGLRVAEYDEVLNAAIH